MIYNDTYNSLGYSPEQLFWLNVYLHNLVSHPSIHTHIYPFAHPEFHPSIHSSIHPSTQPFIDLSIHASIYLSIPPSIHSPICPSTHPFTSIYLPIHLSICLYIPFIYLFIELLIFHIPIYPSTHLSNLPSIYSSIHSPAHQFILYSYVHPSSFLLSIHLSFTLIYPSIHVIHLPIQPTIHLPVSDKINILWMTGSARYKCYNK